MVCNEEEKNESILAIPVVIVWKPVQKEELHGEKCGVFATCWHEIFTSLESETCRDILIVSSGMYTVFQIVLQMNWIYSQTPTRRRPVHCIFSNFKHLIPGFYFMSRLTLYECVVNVRIQLWFLIRKKTINGKNDMHSVKEQQSLP